MATKYNFKTCRGTFFLSKIFSWSLYFTWDLPVNICRSIANRKRQKHKQRKMAKNFCEILNSRVESLLKKASDCKEIGDFTGEFENATRAVEIYKILLSHFPEDFHEKNLKNLQKYVYELKLPYLSMNAKVDLLIFKVPNLAAKLFQYLDIKTLLTCRLVSKKWLEFIEGEKFLWKKLTQKAPGWDLTLKEIDSSMACQLGKAYLTLKAKNCHPIFCAIESENMTIFNLLARLFPNYQSLTISLGKSKPLIYNTVTFSALQGKLYLVRILFDLELSDKENLMKLCIQKAARNGHISVLKYLLSHQNEPNPEYNEERRTILHTTAHNGRFEAFKLIFEQMKSDFNPEDELGWTPLHLAAKSEGKKGMLLCPAQSILKSILGQF